MSKYDDLVRKLKEIFQIDRPELDFGVYRILNARAQEVNDYLENGLKSKVAQSLAESGAGNSEALHKELVEKEAQYRADGLDPDNVPKVKELKQRISELGAGSADHENAVFTHLLTFFSRYYDKGDFISQRRFKGDTYAIPYAGEEVVLHWANKEQYYTKSGESFSNYRFKLDDGRAVTFKLLSADTAKDNRKDHDKERLFILIDHMTRSTVDEDGQMVEEEISPIEEFHNELVIRFQYKAMPKGSKQDALISTAAEKIFRHPAVAARWTDLAMREPTEKQPNRTLLERCLTAYTSKNTADYFIHKDLGGYLRRELDFYIKSEMMHLDDIQDVETLASLEKSLAVIKTFKAISVNLIAFLSQIENFQKQLWLKKKFVVSTSYCLTLDHVPEELLPQVFQNELQMEQWKSLGMLSDQNDLFSGSNFSVEVLQSKKGLMIDTSLFEVEFVERVLAAFDSLDDELDGVLVNSDNFQALNVLKEKYREQVKCIYIDPPYNTSEATFVYKNQYKHSSWLSMISSRVELSKSYMTSDAILQVTIDDAELYRMKGMLDDIYGEQRYIGTVVIQSNPRGRGINSFFATSHDYAVAYANDPEQAKICDELLSEEQEDGYKFSDEKSEYRLLPFRRSGGLSTPVDRPNSEFTLLVDPATTKIIGVGGSRLHPYPEKYASDTALFLSEHGLEQESYADFIARTSATEIYPIDSDGQRRVWRWSDRQKILEHARDGEFVVKVKSQLDYTIQLKDRIKEGRKPKTVWVDSKFDASSHGTNLLADILGDRGQFGYPKSLYSTMASISAVVRQSPKSFVMDFFAGSGTTGHATISLNRMDSGGRRYLLVEQGEYFDTVTKPRIQKVIFSPEWKNGVPLKPEEGISQVFKVLKLESYEDTLNNLSLTRTEQQQSLLKSLPADAKEDYLLRYMLDVESRGSALSVADFARPFDYKLNITVNSAGAFEEKSIDLVETFNHLIGLKVATFDSKRDLGFVLVSGTLPSGEKALVIWRDQTILDYEQLSQLCRKLAINPSDSEFDAVYINGDHNIPAVFTSTEAEGGVTKSLKIRQIEPEFLSRMFNVDA